MQNWLAKFLRRLRIKSGPGPDFDPYGWGEVNDIKFNNNCYNYACDIKGAYAQPGRASGNLFRSYDCEELSRAAISDGFISFDCGKRCPQNCYQVALVISPGNSFHWYRQDRDGLWSHKPGDMPPTKFDASGKLITDPRTADRGPYSIFCGCFCVCKNRISIL